MLARDVRACGGRGCFWERFSDECNASVLLGSRSQSHNAMPATILVDMIFVTIRLQLDNRKYVTAGNLNSVQPLSTIWCSGELAQMKLVAWKHLIDTSARHKSITGFL